MMTNKTEHVYRTYEYRLYPTVQQQVALARRFMFEDNAYNQLADRVNALWSKRAAKKDILAVVNAFSLPYPCQEDADSLAHTKKEMARAVDKLFSGNFAAIFSRRSGRMQRCFYFKKVHISKRHIDIPAVGAVLREHHRQLPEKAEILSGQVFCSTYEEIYRVHLLLRFPRTVSDPKTPIRYHKAIGLDYTQNGLYCASNGTSGAYPGYFVKEKERLKALRQAARRAQRGSNRWKKTDGKNQQIGTTYQ